MSSSSGKRVLGVVVGRGGSKGIPGKNMREVGGRPLIHWPIRAAQASKSVSRLILSTDSDDIVDCVRSTGIEVPFRRPAELASDKALVVDVLRHSLDFCAATGDIFDYVLLLQPTSPFVTGRMIDEAIELASKENADTVITVHDSGHNHPALMYVRETDGALRPFLGADLASRRRQDLPEVFVRTGLLYIARAELVRSARTLYGPRVVGFPVPANRAVCIDTPEDLNYVRYLIQQDLVPADEA